MSRSLPSSQARFEVRSLNAAQERGDGFAGIMAVLEYT
jgi:hypothetical protein